MAVTAQTLVEYRNHVQHATGGGALSSQLAQDQIINEAGRYLVSMHHWKWLEMTPATLTFTISTAYVSMPADFKSLDAIWPDDAINSSFELVTPREIARMREYEITATAAYYGTLVYPTQAAVTAHQTVPRLELYPTPSATTSGALHLWYTRGWTVIDDATDVPNFPPYLETLFTQIVRAFAKGYEEDDQGTLDDRLVSIAGGPIFAAAVSQDGMTQNEYGEIGGGWLESSPMPLTFDAVNNPS